MKNISQAFGTRLRQLRGELSKTVFARKIGVLNPSTYHNYEAGRVPDADVLARIANACGVKIDWLLGVEREEKSTVREGASDYPNPECSLSEHSVRPYSESKLSERITAIETSQNRLAQEIRECAVKLDTLTRLLGASLRRDPERGAAPEEKPRQGAAPENEPLASGD